VITFIVICLILIGIKWHFINRGFDSLELKINELEQKINEQKEMKYRIEELETMLKNHFACGFHCKEKQ
jgi:type II secretory pathway component PulJ